VVKKELSESNKEIFKDIGESVSISRRGRDKKYEKHGEEKSDNGS